MSAPAGAVPGAASRTGGVSAAPILLGVSILLLLLIVAYPLAWLVLSALGFPQGWQLDNLARVFTRSQNLTALTNTLLLAGGAALMSLFLGVPLAWATARTDMPLRRVVQALVALSYITPPYLTALAYVILFGPEAGYFNRPLQALFGLQRGPVDIFGLGGVVFVIGLHVFALTYFLTFAALRSIDNSLEEAARMLGASRWHVARRVTLPLVLPAISGGALLAAVDSMALFGPQAFLGSPAQVTFLPTRIYATIGSYPPRWGEAAALSLVLVVLTVIGLFVQRGLLERRAYVTLSGKGVRTERVPLGLWRWPAFLACSAVVFLSAVAPVGVLALASFSVSWTEPLAFANLTLANYRTALVEDQIATRGIANSFILAGGAALLAVVIGTSIAYIDLRTRLPGRRLLDYLAILPLGLPGTVMAVGVLLAFIRPPLAIYGTMWIILVAYVARFVPLATRSANATLRQIDPALEEAARITGAGWFDTVRLVLLPLARPGLIVAFLLVLVPALSELSATILLYTGGTETIAVAIFRLNDLGRLEVVSALAVFTVGVILAVSVVLNRLSASGEAALEADGGR